MDKVSIVIPSVREDLISDISIAIQNQTKTVHETIIIKDLQRRGPAWARNRGIEKSSGNWIAFLDDDCIPGLHWIEQLINACGEFKAEVAGGGYIETDPFLNEVRLIKPLPQQTQYDTMGIVGIGGNVMYSKKVIDRCISKYGFVFDESYRLASGEDHELSMRLKNMGVRFVYVPVHHKHLKRFTLKKYLREKYIRGKGIAWMHNSIKIHDLNPVQTSLIWDKRGNRRKSSWFRAAWTNLVGPFNKSKFSSTRYFMYYWLGAKMRVLGFLIEKVKLKLKLNGLIKNHSFSSKN